MTNPFFPDDSYATPPETKRDFLDRLLLNSRWWFLAKFVRQVFVSRRYIQQEKYDNSKWAFTSHNIMRAIESSGGRFDIKGIFNLHKAQGPLVIVANHMSTLETMVLPCLVSPIKEATFVVKEKLIRGPFFGKIMRSRDPIVIGRVNPRQDMQTVLNEGARLLKNGRSVILFPEGTRQRDFNPENFNSLGAKLAKKAGVPMLPVALKTDFWGSGKILKGFGRLNRRLKIFMEFGEPVNVIGREKEAQSEVVKFITERMQHWKLEPSI